MTPISMTIGVTPFCVEKDEGLVVLHPRSVVLKVALVDLDLNSVMITILCYLSPIL